MDKLINSIPQILLCAFIGKQLYFGTSLPEMGVAFALSAIMALNIYMEKHKKLEDFTTVINKQNDVIQAMAVEVSKLKTDMQGVKLKSGFETIGPNRVRSAI